MKRCWNYQITRVIKVEDLYATNVQSGHLELTHVAKVSRDIVSK